MKPTVSPPLETLATDWPPPVSGARAGLYGSFFLLDRLEASGHAGIARFQSARIGAWLRHLAAQVPEIARDVARRRGPGGHLRLADLPIGTRELVRGRIESQGALTLPASHGKPIAHSTSGSTGVALRFFYSERSGRFNSTLYLHDHFRHGRDPTRAINLLGGKVPPHEGEHYERSEPDALLETGLVRMRKSVAFSVESHADWLRRHPAAYLVAHPSALSGIVSVYERDDAPARGIEQVLTVGETVDASLRERVRALLGAKVVDRYSCEETGPVAFQCPVHDDWYHVCVANAVVETVGEDGAPLPEGQPGRLLVSAFNNWASPLLRYDVGDIAALHRRCACGAEIPAISQLLGRIRGLIRLPNGERKYLRIVAGHFIEHAPVREWRVTQREHLALEVELVCAEPLSAGQREAITATMRELTDPSFRIDVFEREAIDWGSSYKRQELVCLLDH